MGEASVEGRDHVDSTVPFDPGQPLSDTVFAVFDVETTGLSPTYGHRICEVGCLRVRDGVELARIESLVDPRRSISPGAFRVNRITADMLRGAPTFGQIVDPLLQVMEGSVLVAHNASFDLSFLAAELAMARLPRPENPVVDSLALTRRTYRLARNNLSAVAAALGVEERPTHRAMSDALVTWGVLERIIEELRHRRGITTVGQLIQFQGGSVPYPPAQDVTLPPTIAEALETGERVRMRYVDARGRETERLVRPLRVTARGKHLYLIAHCYWRGERRTFRLDRVVEMALEA